jgi:hypothetical protein
LEHYSSSSISPPPVIPELPVLAHQKVPVAAPPDIVANGALNVIILPPALTDTAPLVTVATGLLKL